MRRSPRAFCDSAVDVFLINMDRAGRGLGQAAENVQQGGFPRAGGADDGNQLALTHLEIDTLQDFHLKGAFPEGLGDAPGIDDGFTHRLHQSYLSASAGWTREARQAGYSVARKLSSNARITTQHTSGQRSSAGKSVIT